MVNVGAMISYEALMWTEQLSAEVGNFVVIAVGNFMVDENTRALSSASLMATRSEIRSLE